MAFVPTQKYIDWIQSSPLFFLSPLEAFRERLKPHLPTNVLSVEEFSEDNLAQVPQWESEAEDQLKRRDYYLYQRSESDEQWKEETKSITQGLVTSRNYPESTPERRPQVCALNNQSFLALLILKQGIKDGVGKHPETDKIIQKFHLNDADWQIDNGKILKTDQLSKNILRNMTRYDKKRIAEIFASIPKQELDEQRQFEIIVGYFEDQYYANDIDSYDADILRTLFAPLKTRQKRLIEEVEEHKRVGQKTPGNKKKMIVNDRLELLNGDPESTARFFSSNPGRSIYLKSFVRIFNVYMRTLREMNLPKRSQGFRNYLKRIEQTSRV